MMMFFFSWEEVALWLHDQLYANSSTRRIVSERANGLSV